MKTWEQRCYSSGIPDDCPDKLMKSLRVPSYKAIALALLKNDLKLTSLGFSGKSTRWYNALKAEKKAKESPQGRLL